MLKRMFLISLLVFLPTRAAAQTYIAQWYDHATDCTSISDGKESDLCYEQDDQTIYRCQPSAGDCDTAGEWKLVKTIVDISDDTNLTVDDGLLLTDDEIDVILTSPGADGDSSTTNSASGMEFINDATGDELSLIRGCTGGYGLKWSESDDLWKCGRFGGIYAVTALQYVETEGGDGDDLVMGVGGVDKITLDDSGVLTINADYMAVGDSVAAVPEYSLYVENDEVDMPVGAGLAYGGQYIYASVDQSADSSRTFNGLFVSTQNVTVDDFDPGSLVGVKNLVTGGTASRPDVYGILNQVDAIGANTTSAIEGINSLVTHSPSSAQSATDVKSLDIVMTNNANSTIDTYYGLYLDTTISGTVTSNWGIYQNDTAAYNKINGSLFIGTDDSGEPNNEATFRLMESDIDVPTGLGTQYALSWKYGDTDSQSQDTTKTLYGDWTKIVGTNDTWVLGSLTGEQTIVQQLGDQDVPIYGNLIDARTYGDSDQTLVLGEQIVVGHTPDTARTLTNMYGIDIGNSIGANSTVTNYYGLFLDDSVNGAITNYYGIYQKETDATNFFEGGIQLDSDSNKVELGEDQDMEIYHDGTDGFIDVTTGTLKVLNGGTEYMRMTAAGATGFGTIATNYSQFDSDGDLSMVGTARYEVGANQSAFVYSLDNDAGLWFDAVTAYTFTDLVGADMASVDLSGKVNVAGGFDGYGAIDLDYGSADITDHTFVSDGGTVIIDGDVTLTANTFAHDGTDFTLDDSLVVGGTDSSSFGTDVVFAEETDGALTYLLGGGEGATKSASAYLKGYNGQLYTATGLSIPMPVSGSVTKIGCSTNVTVLTAGATWDFEVHKNGAAVFSCQINAATTGIKECTGDQVRDTDQFAANDNLTLYANESGTNGSTIADVQCAVWGYFDE